MSATEAIIHFIGIVMLTASVPNDPGVHAIVPRIDGSGTILLRRASSPSKPQGVEAHTAVILYQKSKKIGISNWTPTTFRTTWEYVVLQGERLQFVTTAPNVTPSIPSQLPHACPTMTLQSSFQPPDFTGAAAVVDIPEGSIDVCLANPSTSGDEMTRRADTRVFVKTNGSLVVVATKPNAPARTITFSADATVYIANIPPRHLGGIQQLAVIGLPHHAAYDLIGGTSNCTQVPNIGSISNNCGSTVFKTAGGGEGDWSPQSIMINSECSNTQWP